MNVPCGNNKEARVLYFVYKNGKWENRNLAVLEIPFFLTPPRISRKPVFCNMTEGEKLSNRAFNAVLDSVVEFCTDKGPMGGWLVFFFFFFLKLHSKYYFLFYLLFDKKKLILTSFLKIFL